MNLTELLDTTAARWPQKPALIEEATVVSGRVWEPHLAVHDAFAASLAAFALVGAVSRLA